MRQNQTSFRLRINFFSYLHEKFITVRDKIDFSKYYKKNFQQDLLNFIEANFFKNSHRNRQHKTVYSIQYFALTPNYIFLEVVPKDRRSHFIVALFWIVLMDQVCYTYFKLAYPTFQSNTKYPKFIGNCTASSLFASKCGHHQHPKRILFAVNDSLDKGNRYISERERYVEFMSDKKRDKIDFNHVIEGSKSVMKKEIKNYFQNNQPEVDWMEFWRKCDAEIPKNTSF